MLAAGATQMTMCTSLVIANIPISFLPESQ